jgi:hypothetical protein
MRSQVAFALIAFGLNSLLMQTLSAAQVLAVSSNGKWAMVYNPAWDANFKAVSEQAISECKAKGGTDPKIVWSVRSNIGIHSYKNRNPIFVRGAVAVSNNGTGQIVGWCFDHGYHNEQSAIKECQRKGGQNPKVVAKF